MSSQQPVKKASKVTVEARPGQEVTPDSTQLVKEQTEGSGAVAINYKAVQTRQEVPREQIEAGGLELKKLYQRLLSMTLSRKGVLEIQLALNAKPRWVAICPEQNRRR